MAAKNTLEKPAGYTFAAYAGMLPIIQERARELGYCIAVHGSGNRDLDLVAVPWTTDAKPAHELHALLVKLFSPYTEESLKNPAYGPQIKPHGRKSWIIPLGFGAAIDLSVTARYRGGRRKATV